MADSSSSTRSWSSIFALPQPVRQLFNSFPLETYLANPLPCSTSGPSSQHKLYIFASPSDAADGRPSLNPTCLRYQTYLHLRSIPFSTVSSNNHASPSGALPFLQLAKDTNPGGTLVASSLRRWTDARSASSGVEDIRLDVYASLLDHRLRRAWLYQLYLDSANAAAMEAQYAETVSRTWLVRMVTAAGLRKAAGEELRKSGDDVSAEDLLAQGREALQALEDLLASRGGKWFVGDEAGWFDAAVYAYTGPLLDERMGWVRNDLGDALRDMTGLIKHRAAVEAHCGWA